MSSESDDETFTWQKVAGFAAVIVVLLAVLPLSEPPQSTSETLTTQFAARSNTGQLGSKLEELGFTADNPLTARLDYQGPEEAEKPVRSELGKVDRLRLSASASNVVRIDAYDGPAARTFRFVAELQMADRQIDTTLVEVERRTGGWVSILPPLLAVLFALFFRRIVIALLAAVFLGAALQTGFNPIAATWMMISEYLWGSVADSFSLYIIGFTFCLVGMVHVIIRMGGIAGLLEAFSWLANSMRSTRVATSLMGLALFFDDYANTIVVGTTMRPLTDRQKISREKLAYLVDSTSAPIAGLAVISTWIGYEVGLFEELAGQLQLEMSGYGIFFQILPLRFYCILTLVFVFMIAILGRDYGPMLTAERRALRTGDVLRPGSSPLTSSDATDDVEPKEGIPHRWINAVVPVACVIVGTLLGMYWSGWRSPEFANGIPGLGQLLTGDAAWGTFVAAWGAAFGELLNGAALLDAFGSLAGGRIAAFFTALMDAIGFEAIRDALSNAANAKVLFWGSVVGSLVAIAMATGQKLLELDESIHAWIQAIPMMGLAVAILVLAWSIQGVCSDLGTSIYLVGSVQHLVGPTVLPVLTFGLAAVVAFSTGTSWGTMGILLPAMIPMAYHMTAGLESGELLLMMCFGAVLDGAIFGDHCSPISDTTVMSSIASSVDHIDHVRTQMPYALTSMTASLLVGYIGVAIGLPILAAYGLGALLLLAVVLFVGREPKVENETA